MPEELKTKLDELGHAFEEFKSTNDERIKEIQEKGQASAETEQKLAKLEEDISNLDEIKSRLEQAEAALKRKRHDGDGNEVPEEIEQYKAALSRYLRKGHDAELFDSQKKAFEKSGPEMKALAVQSDPDGGYLVSPDETGRMATRIFETSPIRQVAAVQSITTDALEGIIDDDEADAGWVGETQARGDTDTPQLGKWRIPVHEIYAKPKATQKLLEDAAVDVEAWLSGKVADKFSRMENAAFVNGDGVAKPRGFLTYPDWAAAGTYERGAIERVASGAVGGIDPDELITLVYTLKSAYRAMSAQWAMNRLTMSVVRKLKDNDDQYLWAPGLQAGKPSTLLGYPVQEFDDMPDVATGALSLGLAAWAETYQIVDRLGVATLRDPYSAKPYVEFYTRKRVGGDVVNFDSIKLMEIG